MFLCGYNTKKKELLKSAVRDLKRPLLQSIINFNIKDVLNKNKNKPNEPMATVPKKMLLLLPYTGLHSNHTTKRLKSCVNRFYSFVNVKVTCILQNCRGIKSYFPDKDRLKRSQLLSFIKLVAGTSIIFTLGKRNDNYTTGKRNISRPFRKVITLLLLLITIKQLVKISSGTILTLWILAKLPTIVMIVRLRRPCFFQELQPPLNANVSSEKLFLY